MGYILMSGTGQNFFLNLSIYLFSLFLAASLWEPIERVACRCVRCHTIISHFSTGQQLNNQLEYIDVQLFVVRGNERRLHTLSMAGNRFNALPAPQNLPDSVVWTCHATKFRNFFHIFRIYHFYSFNFLEAFKRHCLPNFSI